MNEEELVGLFWEALPERLNEGTKLWLRAEEKDDTALAELRRLLHSLKGEAQMFILEECAGLAENLESLIDGLRGVDEWPPDVGNSVLAALDAMSVLAPDALPEEEAGAMADEARAALQFVMAGLGIEPKAAGKTSRKEAAEVEEQEPRPADEQSDIQAVSVARLEPVVTELRRLYSQTALLHPRLVEIGKMLRVLLRELDARVSPERIAETIVKTLGYGADIDQRLRNLLAEWSATEFVTTASLDQLEDLVRGASMVPLSRIDAQVQRTGRSAAQATHRLVWLKVRGEPVIDGALERRLRPVLLHLVRNAVDHGIEPPEERRAAGKNERGAIDVSIERVGTMLRVVVADDGRGIDFERVRERLLQSHPELEDPSHEEVVRALFRQGFTTRDEVSSVSGRGVGLDVVYREVVAGGGRVDVESIPGTGTRFGVLLPSAVQVDTVMPVAAAGLRAAIPSNAVVTATRLSEVYATPKGPVTRIDGVADGEHIPVLNLAGLFGVERDSRGGDTVLAVRTPGGMVALVVDGYSSPRALVTQPVQNDMLRSPLVHAVAPTPDGSVLLILDVAALRLGFTGTALAPRQRPSKREAHILVVEDATVARELLVGVLRSFGMRVTEAIDGGQGLERAIALRPDIILTDIEMPVMDGLEMIERIRDTEGIAATPVLILSTREDEQTLTRARELQVLEFVPKRRFEQNKLRELIERVLDHV